MPEQAALSRGHRLAIHELTREFGPIVAVDHASLEVQPGEFVAVLGPSGCGKTTLLRMIGGLTPPTSGEIWLDDHRIDDLPPNERSMGFVFQQYALFPHMNVSKNVAFGLEMRRVPRTDISRRVKDALGLVQMSDYGQRRVRQLSGGQQQRVALARAIVTEPQVLLLDEPFSNLDAKLRIELRSELRDLQRKLGITTVFVTHDQAEAMTLADRVIVMNAGRIVQQGSSQNIFESPADLFVAAFVGRANFFAGTVVGTHDGIASIRLGDIVMPARANNPTIAGDVTVMVRPHRIQLAARQGDTAGLAGTVRDVRYLGDHLEVIVVVGTRVVEVSLPETSPPVVTGEHVVLSWAPDDAVVLD
jgi:putative spermidine/putrescine transport system ATP-binding protein